MNRLKYDQCATSMAQQTSVMPVQYQLDILKFEQSRPCFADIGIVGGSTTPLGASRVDVENDLRGITRPSTKCQEYKYTPCQNPVSRGVEYIKPMCHPSIDNTKVQELGKCPAFFTRPTMAGPPDMCLRNVCSR